MRDPAQAAWLLYQAEMRRVTPRFLRSLISPAVFVVLAFVGPKMSVALAVIAIGTTLALGIVAEALQLSADREGTVLAEMNRLPLSGATLASARLASAATFAAAGVLVAAVVAAVFAAGGAGSGAWAMLGPSVVLRAMPLAILGSMVASAVAARISLGRAIAIAVIITVVVSRLPLFDGIESAELRAWLDSSAVSVGIPLLAGTLLAIGFASWLVLVRTLQPRRAPSTRMGPTRSHG